ncbi:MAG: ComEC/Rec2 family competence protein [Minisyncoccia bacterium]
MNDKILFVVGAGFAAGTLLRSFFIFGTPFLIFILIPIAILGFAYKATEAKGYILAAVFLLALLCGAGRTMLTPQTLPAAFVPSVGENISREGIIVSDPDVRETNQRVTVRIQEEDSTTRILVVAPTYPELSYGMQVQVSGKLEIPKPFEGDGDRIFAYDTFLAKDGVFGIVQQGRIEIISSASGIVPKSVAALYSVKHVFIRGLQNALPEPEAGLATGILVGGKQGLGKDLLEAFTISGLVQIVVLSGYNVMIIAEAFLRALSFLPKRFARMSAGVGIIFFVILAGAGSSLVRAALMACLALFARATGRIYDALRGLCAVLILMLLWNPLLLAFDPGFQLSLIATLGLIVGTPIVEKRLTRIRNGYLRDIVATTIAAQVAVLPLLLWQTGNLSFISFIANVLVAPAVPIAMAFSFIAGLVGIIIPIIAPALGIPAYFFLAYIVSVAEYAAAFPFAHAILPSFGFVLVILSYGFLWWFVQKYKEPEVHTT